MATTQTTTTLLGRMVIERLDQLGVSRRQFCMSYNISRQTLYEIEHCGKTNLLPSTFDAINTGCYWEPGTAEQYATGESPIEAPTEERVHQYVRTIVDRITHMTIEELERESIWLEQELFGRNSDDMAESIDMIRDAFRRIFPTLQGAHGRGTRAKRNRRTHEGTRVATKMGD